MNNNINKQTELANLGLIDYKEAWDLQEKMLAATIQIKLENRTRPRGQQAPTPNHLIFCEHPHVYTLGKTGNPSNLLLGDEGLKEADAAFYKINRGGDNNSCSGREIRSKNRLSGRKASFTLTSADTGCSSCWRAGP